MSIHWILYEGINYLIKMHTNLNAEKYADLLFTRKFCIIRSVLGANRKTFKPVYYLKNYAILPIWITQNTSSNYTFLIKNNAWNTPMPANINCLENISTNAQNIMHYSVFMIGILLNTAHKANEFIIIVSFNGSYTLWTRYCINMP